jgi:protein gp37
MSDNSSIEWTDASWNPVTGCTKVSPGCDHCYAERDFNRFNGAGAFDTVRLMPNRLATPLRWRKPRRIFVNSMSDLFHDDVPDEFIARVFAVMALADRHTYQVLTKRHGRLRSLLSSIAFHDQVVHEAYHLSEGPGIVGPWPRQWPLRNVWLGVSVENQQWADIRIPALLDTPAAVRFLSCEPLLGRVALHGEWVSHINWVIVGGESGRNARPMHPDWARLLRDECLYTRIPFFFKQHGEWEPIGPLYGLTPGDDDAAGQQARDEAVALEVINNVRVVELERDGTIADGYQPADSRTWLMAKVGKKNAGRELDGRTWDEYPAAGAQAVLL